MTKHELILIEKKLSFLKLFMSSITAATDVAFYSYRTMKGSDLETFLHDLSQSLVGSQMLIQAEINKLEKSLLEPEKTNGHEC